MDIENLTSWISQPDVCRCCLSTGGTWDLTDSYTTEAGIKEVYSDMLQECFGIALSNLSEWGSSHLVCNLCVTHLRDACSFRKQVQEAEKLFVDYSDIKRDELKVKEENPLQTELPSPDHLADTRGESDDKDTLQDIEQTIIKKHKTKIKKNKKQKSIDYDSDTPIAELTRHRDVEQKVSLQQNGGIHQNGPLQLMKVKQISERKRVILTCNIVLRDTTACPFRHHKSWFQCFFCSQDFMEINLLRNHTNQFHSDIDVELKKIKRYPRSLQIDISNLTCRHCDLTLTDVIAMRRHFVDVHNKIIYNECIADYKVNSSPYSCHLCKKQFHVFRTLTTHLNEHYANCICDVCGKSFINSKRLKVHKRTHENGSYPCNKCGKVLKTKTSKANHIESVHSNRVIKCQICFKPMKHYNERIKHMSEIHNITHKFTCPICSRVYNIKHYLATHIRQTHGHKNKKCVECGMAFITNHGLKKHMQRHSGEKPYSCSICSKSYARSYTLREHLRAHESDKRFICS